MFSEIVVEEKKLSCQLLAREVKIDIYFPEQLDTTSQPSLLIINDGQDLAKMNFGLMFDQLISSNNIGTSVCVGVHAGDRLQEYGTAGILDFAGRGTKALLYQRFLIEELLPFIHINCAIEKFKSISIAGFSLGGLSAMDTAWSYPRLFSLVGVFSGSLWWRSKDLANGYNEETDRIIHQKIKGGKYHPGLKFYFATGSLDETADRNNNGIIDSIDDTLDLIKELKKIGYVDDDIRYTNYEDGRHDVESWGRAMPQFLLWACSK